MIFLFASTQANLLFEITDGNFRAKKYNIPVSMNDGEHYTQLTEEQSIVKYSYKTGLAVDTIFSLKKVKNPIINKITGYEFSPKETRILLYNNVTTRYRRSFTAEYYVYDIRQRELDPLSKFKPQEAPLFSPDDRYVAFAHNNNLHMKKVDYKSEIPITKDGVLGKVINGIADWLYEEEFGAVRYFSWSPDSKLLAFVRFDENQVKNFSFQQFKKSETGDKLFYPELTGFKYPKAGETNVRVAVCIYNDFNKTTQTVNLNEQDDSFYVPRFMWTNNPEQLAVFVLNRNQNRLDMLMANPRTGISKLLLRQEDKRYIDYSNIDYTRFTQNNESFYAVNESDGYRHIYEHTMDGRVLRQVTKGNWDVTDFYGVNEAKKLVYYQSAENSPMQRDIYVVNSRGAKTLLSSGKGTSDAYFSSSFNYFVCRESGVATPERITLRNNSGKTVRELENNAALKLKADEYKLNQKEFFSFKTTEDISLNGWILKPQNFDQTKKYPLLLIQYSGPDSQQALDRWNIGWEYYLSTLGYVVACVDGRGTGARGSEFRKCTYMQMGVLEAKDQVETARYFGDQTYIDKNRIGIWGWSYGGSTTLWAMSTGEKVFKAGISVAPVTDWLFYNTAYTERFMKTPQENFRGYELTSALQNASKLEGRLLIVHGTADDNVHYHNTLLYTDKLVEAGKQFEMQIYTDKNHSITGKGTRRHLYTRMVDFLERNL
jgi:dipeptidyl-peptidase 4